MPDELYYRVSVTAEGASYDLSSELASFTLEQRDMEPDRFTVHAADQFKVLSHALQEGMDVEVELGTASDHAVIFRGRIYRVEGTFPSDDPPNLKIVAYDRSMRLGLRKRNRVFAGKALSAIVKDVVKSASFKDADVHVDLRGDPTFEPNGIRQEDETDLAFLLRLAAACGCVMYVKPGDKEDAFYFVSQYSVMKADPEITIHHGRDGVPNHLLRFQASADIGRIQLPRVLSGIDYETGKAVDVATAEIKEVGKTDDALFDENLTAFRQREQDRAEKLEKLLSKAKAARDKLKDELGDAERAAVPTLVTKKQLDQIGKNQFSTSLKGMQASGATDGLAGLRARTSVAIADVGGRFSGTWYLAEVRHTLDKRGHTTEFECRR